MTRAMEHPGVSVVVARARCVLLEKDRPGGPLHIVLEKCDQCGACILVCPQVDTTIKSYVVNHRMVEVMSRLGRRIADEDEPDLDLFLEEAVSSG